MVTTDISDVKKVLAEKALYISGEGPYELISQIHWIVHNRDAARTIAQEGARLVNRMFNSRDTGQRLLTFLLPNLPC